MPHHRAFTLVDLVMLIALVGLLLALMLPVGVSLGSWQRSNTQLRGIHQAMIVYAQGNNGHFPGLDRTGQPTAITVEERFWLLLDTNHVTPDYLISPYDNGHKQQWSAGPFTSDHYSFALLQVPTAGGRYDEWHETLSRDAIVMSDRNTGTAANPASLFSNQPIPDTGIDGCSWTQQRYGPGWSGGVVRNDNSVPTETTHLHDTAYAGHAHVDDHLFEAAGDDDAYLIHSGN